MRPVLPILMAASTLALLSACEGDPFWQDWSRTEFGTEYEVRQESDGGPWVLIVKRPVDEERDSVIAELGPFPAEPPVLVEVLPEISLGRPERDSLRFVLESTEGEGTDSPVCVIRIVDADGTLLGEHRKAGECDRVRVDDEAGEKLVFVDPGGEGSPGWVLIDFWTGALLGESTGTTLPEGQEVIHVQGVGDHVLVVLRFRDAADIRIQIFGPGGGLLHAFDIPGDFRDAVDDGIDTKAITTERDGDVHNDLVNVVSGDVVRVAGLAQNPLTGEHQDLQYHRVGDEDRFVETVYDPGRNETTVRILDGSGRIVATRVWTGEFRAARSAGERKVFVVERPPLIDVFVVDLGPGDEIRSETVRGSWAPSLDRPFVVGPDGVAEVPVENDGQSSVIRVPVR